MTYQPDFDVDLARGEEAEGLYRALRSDIASGRAEVKRDDRAHQTGNVYVEYRCKRRDGWHKSGIATTKSDVWVFHLDPTIVAIRTPVLLDMCRDYWRRGCRRSCIVGSHPTEGVVIPIAELVLHSMSKVHDASHGAPTDEPPPPAPADTDTEAQLRFGDDEHPDTFSLPTVGQSHEWASTGTYTPDPQGWTT